jgi:hypothetical protein
MLIVRIAVAEITMAATTAVVGSDRRGTLREPASSLGTAEGQQCGEHLCRV